MLHYPLPSAFTSCSQLILLYTFSTRSFIKSLLCFFISTFFHFDNFQASAISQTSESMQWSGGLIVKSFYTNVTQNTESMQWSGGLIVKSFYTNVTQNTESM